MNADTPIRGAGIAAAVVRLTGVWVLAGALGKLFLGTPKLLPPVVIDLVREHTNFSLTFTFQAVIAIEIIVAGLAFLKPKYAWLILLGMMAFFDWILMQSIAGGEESCGCFGGSIKVSPHFMLTVDSIFLLLLLVTMPWKRLKKPGASWFWMLIVTVIAILAPWLKINAAVSTPPKPVDTPVTTGTGGDGPTSPGTNPVAPGVEPGAAQGPDTGQEPPETPPVAVVDADWVEFDPEDWLDKLVYDIEELPTYGIDIGLMPVDGVILLWRQGCDHCAEHMSSMAQSDTGDRQIVMLQIQDDLNSSRAVSLMPQGPHVTELQFPEGLEFLIQTPWEIHVEGGMVTDVLDPEELEGK